MARRSLLWALEQWHSTLPAVRALLTAQRRLLSL